MPRAETAPSALRPLRVDGTQHPCKRGKRQLRALGNLPG